ncbi:PREDICTED: G-type lectin S-receptor-like serine/threonine-protein kinase LECRK1 [Nelumbo nucifera]|uniref:Receptor-like serine/threonine-protein kinase n=1 Tax=Nelumbo nucifera TaxID=4432 RepID=A0A1U7ZHY4_NELNU|nr:PREDICTED: G-type lectin S-receptor-like serine/threonine-protein kinase LECRK1 [Nelumbo nucifera]
MASTILVLSLLLSVSSAVVGVQDENPNLIKLGSSLSPTIQPSSWSSPSGRFAFGFYQQGNGFSVGIWLVEDPVNTVVWTAKRDDQPVSSDATLNLTTDGWLVLRTGQGEETTHIINASKPASFASMLDSGNFVLYDYNNSSEIIWESFDSPTDTILGGQILMSRNKLVSSESETDHSSGRFYLIMQEDGNLVAYPVNTTKPIDAYWATGTFAYNYNHSLYLYPNGTLMLGSISDFNASSSPSAGRNGTIFRATLDPDGIFRRYSHNFGGNGSRANTTIRWSALHDPCEVKGVCGFNSYCSLVGTKHDCVCLPGFDFIDPNRRFRGCERNFTEEGCLDLKDTVVQYKIISVENLILVDHPFSTEFKDREDCEKSCLDDRNCAAAQFQIDSCKKQKLPLRYLKMNPNVSSTVFFKVSSGFIQSRNRTSESDGNKRLVLIVTVSLGSLTCLFAAIAISSSLIYRRRKVQYTRLLQNGNMGLSEEFTLRLFTYEELEKATNGFKEELGRGSLGAVYRGVLSQDNRIVAVKRLEKIDEGEREFKAEMSAIGRTHHKNLIRLLGFCIEGSKRLLVYEYMSSGSLAQILFNAEGRPIWRERIRIALDIARGILYLHEECETRIIHCDIKPQNVLMDEFWTAKISDFGLAKLLMPNQTRTFTGFRGTGGYVAPEWQKNVPITVKADVYSFGIVLLEIVCCRSNMEVNVSSADEIILSSWVYNCFVAGELDKLVGYEEVDMKALERMVKIALWCIQDEPAHRPSMKTVILMIEGIVDTSIPPSPCLSFVNS